jgi:hypothetical protein
MSCGPCERPAEDRGLTGGTNSAHAWPDDGVTRVPYFVYEDADLYQAEQRLIFRGPVWKRRRYDYYCAEYVTIMRELWEIGRSDAPRRRRMGRAARNPSQRAQAMGFAQLNPSPATGVRQDKGVEIIRMHLSISPSPQVNFAASGGGPSKAGSRRRSSISSVSASAAKSLRADSDVRVPSRKSEPVR